MMTLSVSLYCALPRDSSILKAVLYQFLVSIMGTCALLVDSALPEKDNVVRFYVMYPVLREFCRFLAIRCSWYLFFEHNIGGGLGEPRREFAWPFYSWILLCFAVVYRFQLSSRSDEDTLFLILYQSALEFFLRLTMLHRDELANGLISALKGVSGRGQQGQVRKVTMLIVGDASFGGGVVSDKLESGVLLNARKSAKASLYSQVVLVEMLSEYIGILLVPFLCWFGKDQPLLYRLPQYLHSGSRVPHLDSMDLTPVYKSSAVQLLLELAVDTFCCYFEQNAGLDLYGVCIKMLCKTKRLLLIHTALLFWTVWYAYEMSYPLAFAHGDRFSACQGHDMCCCSNGNGLDTGGLLEQYCVFHNRSNTTTRSGRLQDLVAQQ
jgi:hypothetical protein